MTFIEQKYLYYINRYSDLGLPNNFSTINFFDKEFFDYLINIKKNEIYYFHDQDLEILLETNNILDELIYILCDKTFIKIVEFNIQILLDKIKKNKEFFISKFIPYINNPPININIIKVLKKDEDIIELICNSNITNIEVFTQLIKSESLSQDKFKKLLKNINFKEMFFNLIIDDFLEIIENKNLSNELSDLINLKLEGLNYSEIISILQKRYNVIEMKPEYLTSLYETYKDELKKEKIKGILLRTIKTFPEDKKVFDDVNDILNTSLGKEVLLTRFLEPTFSNIITYFNLDESLKFKRKEMLQEILNNCQDYSTETIKSVFCALHFELSCHDAILNLKTILEYAKNSERARNIINDKYKDLILIYNFLNSEEIDFTFNTHIDLNLILNDLFNLFKQELSEKVNTNHSIKEQKKVKSKDNKEISIYTLDNTKPENNFFLIHSTYIGDDYKNKKTDYQEKAKKQTKICLSLLGKNKFNTFLRNNTVVIFGYTNFENFNLYSATTKDGQSNQSLTSKQVMRSNLLPLDKFLSKTDPKSYNEINFYTSKDNALMPSYILSIDKEPTEIEIEIASQFNIPIYVYYINQKENIEEDFIEDTNQEFFDNDCTIKIEKNISKKIESKTM